MPRTAPEPTNAENIDRKQAADAYRKVMAGQELTSREQTALKRFEKQREEKLRGQYYRTIPQKHWREMSGRQTKVLHEQAALYGIPFGEAVIDLPKVVRALHDFLAANGRKLMSPDDDLLQAGVPSPALERYREERAALAKLDRQEREGTLLPREGVRSGMARIAARLRGAGEALERQFGASAREILDEALDDAVMDVTTIVGGEASVCDDASPE